MFFYEVNEIKIALLVSALMTTVIGSEKAHALHRSALLDETHAENSTTPFIIHVSRDKWV